MRIERLLPLLLALLCFATPAMAQTFTVPTISVSDYGSIVAANSGQTVFRASATTGVVTRVSGTGTILSTPSVRSLVTIRCGNQNACNTRNARVSITISGSPTGRAGPLNNFTVSTSGASGTIAVAPGTGNSITFQLGPIGRNSSKTFWLGSDLPINGNNTSGATGTATSGFVVTVSRTSGLSPSSTMGSTQARVLRALSISATSNLNFGKIVRPRIGTGSVSLNATTGTVSVTGTGAAAISSASTSRATYSITGEGGQSISVAVPGSMTMTGPGGSIAVAISPTLSGNQTLSGSLGGAGSLNLGLGGSFTISSTTATGTYSGSIAVTVQYN